MINGKCNLIDSIRFQVTALLRRILPELDPELFASLVSVETLPSMDYSILQSTNSIQLNK